MHQHVTEMHQGAATEMHQHVFTLISTGNSTGTKQEFTNVINHLGTKAAMTVQFFLTSAVAMIDCGTRMFLKALTGSNTHLISLTKL